MEDIRILSRKSDCNLIADLKVLVTQERGVLTQILKYLKEVETRKLYLAMGYSSLFAFLIGEINYSESAAQRRIEAMRLMRDVPELEAKIENGEISLTVASQVGTFIRQEGHKRKIQKTEPITRDEKLNLLECLQGSSSRECEKKLAEIAPETCIPKEKTRPITDEKTLIQLTVGKDLMNKIQKLKGLLSHQNETGSLEGLLDRLADIALEKLDPERREARRQNRNKSLQQENQNCTAPLPAPEGEQSMSLRGGHRPTKQSLGVKTNSRHIPQLLRDQIWLRDKGQCQYGNPKTGKICGSTQRLELDHRFPFALGGENSADNLQIKCRAHNQWRAGILFQK